MTQIEMIEEVLTNRYKCRQGSAITQALAYCVFCTHSDVLVHRMDGGYAEMSKAITPAMVRIAAGSLDTFTNALYTRLAVQESTAGPRRVDGGTVRPFIQVPRGWCVLRW